MKKMGIVLVAAMSLASFGCKKKGGMGDAISKLSGFKDQMCKCTDATCAQKVSEEMTTWTQQTQKDQKQAKPSDEEQKKMADITKQLTDCMTKAMGTGGGAMGGGDTGSAAGSAGGDMGSAAGSAGGDMGSAAGSAAPAEGSAAGSAAPAEGSAAGSAMAPAGDKKGAMDKK